VIDVHMTERVSGERGRVLARGSRTDTGEIATLLAIYETASTWVFYPPIGECGVRLSRQDAIGVAEAILASSR
jgi:hypothetical protein